MEDEFFGIEELKKVVGYSFLGYKEFDFRTEFSFSILDGKKLSADQNRDKEDVYRDLRILLVDCDTKIKYKITLDLLDSSLEFYEENDRKIFWMYFPNHRLDNPFGDKSHFKDIKFVFKELGDDMGIAYFKTAQAPLFL